MAAPAWGSASETHSTGANITAPAPASTAQNDLLLAFVFVDLNTPTVTTVGSGYSLTAGPEQGSAGDERIWVYQKLAGASEGNTTWGLSVTNRAWSVIICRITGNDTTTPVNASATRSGTSSASQAVAQPTTTVADCLIVAFISNDQTAVTPPWYTPPSGTLTWTERLDNENTNSNEAYAVATAVLASASQVPADTWTLTAADSTPHITVAVAPGSSATPKAGDDAGSGADTSSVAPAVTGTEIGTGTDTASTTAAATASDVAAGVDSAVVESVPDPKAGTDTGAGTDTASLTNAAAADDAAAGADTGAVSTAVAATDIGGGTDAGSLTASPTGAETSSGSDTGALGATLSASDVGTGVDSASVVDVGGNDKTGSDLSAADDTASAAASVAASDTATATDSAVVTVILTGTDTASAADLAALAAQVSASDLAAALDAGTQADTGGRDITVEAVLAASAWEAVINPDPSEASSTDGTLLAAQINPPTFEAATGPATWEAT